jgi:phage terminase small subunit
LDSFQLAAFATAWALHKMAAMKLTEPGFEPVYTISNGARAQNPWLSILDKQATILSHLGDRLGLDPKSRNSLRLPGNKPKSQFDGLIGQRGSYGSLNSSPSRAA